MTGITSAARPAAATVAFHALKAKLAQCGSKSARQEFNHTGAVASPQHPVRQAVTERKTGKCHIIDWACFLKLPKIQACACMRLGSHKWVM